MSDARSGSPDGASAPDASDASIDAPGVDGANTNDAAAGGAVTVSSEYFGQHTLLPKTQWPTVPFGAMRMAGVSWYALEPATANTYASRNHYEWSGLDDWVTAAQAHHQDLVYTFLHVPSWVASDSTSLASPPNDLAGPCEDQGPVAGPASTTDCAYREFVSNLVTTYKGKIKAYELWNEVNDSAYWTGTVDQMLAMAKDAYAIIKAVDPNAIVIAPNVTATGYPNFYTTWLEDYLQAGGASYADAASWHGYMADNKVVPCPFPELGTSPDSDAPCVLGQASCPGPIRNQIVTLRQVLDANGMMGKPLWDTEGGTEDDALSADEEAAFLARWYLLQVGEGVARAYWYQWDNPTYGTLATYADGGSQPTLTKAGVAYQSVSGWLTGATIEPCTEVGSGEFVCELHSALSVQQEIVWTTDTWPQTRSYSTPYVHVQDLDGTTATATGTVAISAKPVLLY